MIGHREGVLCRAELYQEGAFLLSLFGALLFWGENVPNTGLWR